MNNNNLPYIIVLGHGRHGKDTFKEIICKKLGLECPDDSMIMIENIYQDLGYDSAQELYDTRHEGNNREILRDKLSEFFHSFDRPARFSWDYLLQPYGVRTGIRQNDEYDDVIKFLEENGHDYYVFYVKNDKRPLEPTMSIEYDPNSMVLIDNTHDNPTAATFAELEGKTSLELRRMMAHVISKSILKRDLKALHGQPNNAVTHYKVSSFVTDRIRRAALLEEYDLEDLKLMVEGLTEEPEYKPDQVR